jgi:hypothetical protein
MPKKIQLTQKAEAVLCQFVMAWPAFCAADPDRAGNNNSLNISIYGGVNKW